MIIFLISFWVVSGVLSYGMMFAYWQRAYPMLAEDFYWEDVASCFFTSLLGPIALLADIVFLIYGSRRGFQGFLWK